MSNDTMIQNNDDDAPEPKTNQLVRRGFAGIELASENGATQALIAKSRADIEARWVMAMRNPRDLDEVRQLMRRECKRPGFAEVATYARPVGKKQDEKGNWVEAYAEGLSIRFAEVALRCMSNMTIESMTIFDSPTERMVRVVATDLESNGTWSRDITIKKTVERKQLKKGQAALGQRLNTYGDRVFIVEATDSEVTVKEAAEVSKASRTAILRLIPGHLQDEMFDLCRQTAADKNARDPEGAKNAVLDGFAALQVSKDDLEAYLGHPITKASPAQISDLRKLGIAIKEGDTTWMEAMADSAKTSAPPAPAQASPQAVGAHASPPVTEPAKPAQSRAQSKPKGVDALKTTIAGNSFSNAADAVRAKDAERKGPPPGVAMPVAVDSTDPSLDPVEVPCTTCGNPVLALPGEAAMVRCDACANA